MCKYDPGTISNEFGKFYSNTGNLAKQIKPGSKGINEYISQIPRTLNSLALQATSALEIEKIISSLPNKTSYGHNEISNKMLKAINKAISMPFSKIFNQLITEGKFLELMKLAEVVPLYKSKKMDIIINYTRSCIT